jgi:hypothetical protein
MSLALSALVALTPLVCGAVAAVPAVVMERAPQPRDQALVREGEAVWIVRGPGDHWYLNGEAITRGAIASLLQGESAPGEIRFLPSGALPLGEVTDALAWLRELSAAPVVLELPSHQQGSGGLP